MELFFDRQRTQRPAGPMVVDWSNPITRGLVSVRIAGHNGGWTVNGASLIASPVGLSEKYVSASSNYIAAPLAVTYPLTMFALHRQTSIGVTRSLVSVGNSATGRHLLYLGPSNELLVFSGSSPGQWGSTSAGVFYSDTTTYHMAVGVVRGSANRQGYYDGVSPFAANTGIDSVAASNTVAIGAYWTGGGPTAGFYWPGEIALAGVFNRALSDAEIKSLSDDPWQLFARRRIWVPSSTPGGSYSIAAQPGSYSVTGQSSTITRSKHIVADVGSYSLSGQNATINYTPTGTNYTITANHGTYSITGQVATLLRSKQIVADAGSYSLTGQNATINYSGSGTTTLKAGSWIRYRIIT